MAEKAIIYDASICNGCKACQTACKEWNQLPSELPDNKNVVARLPGYEGPIDLSSRTWLIMRFTQRQKTLNDLAIGRRSCVHCTNAACLTVCPVKAIHRTAEGFIAIDQAQCIGCRLCNYHCPYAVPKFDDHSQTSWKCDACQDRILMGLEPACVKSCPVGALQYMERSEALISAKQRLTHLDDSYYVYGEKEFEGLHVLNIIRGRPEVYGLPASSEIRMATYFWREVIRPVGLVASAATILALSISFFSARSEGGEDSNGHNVGTTQTGGKGGS